MEKYEIFISYRRVGTGDKAEHLKDLLDRYYKDRISFDRENLTGLFAPKLIERIDGCKDFILIVGKESFRYEKEDFEPDTIELYTYLGKCPQQDFEAKINELGPNAGLDFVRIEIARALNRKGLNIIPLVPQTSSDFSFSKLDLPDDIVHIKDYEAIFYSDNADALFKDVIPKLRPHLKSRPDVPFKTLILSVAILLIIAAAAAGAWIINQNQIKKHIQEEVAVAAAYVKDKSMDTETGQYLNCSSEITLGQIRAINSILHDMTMVEGGTFMQGAAPNADGSYDGDVFIKLETPQIEQTVETYYMSQREVTVSDWNSILQNSYDEAKAHTPMTEISFEECAAFIQTLRDLTGLEFNIPTEAQWEYAARGGVNHDEFKYSGSDNPDAVSVYDKTKGEKPSDKPIGQSPVEPNSLGIFHMSGNVSEWCSDVFKPYNPEVRALNTTDMVIRGGSFESPDYELTVYHRGQLNPEGKSKTIGLRLVISK